MATLSSTEDHGAFERDTRDPIEGGTDMADPFENEAPPGPADVVEVDEPEPPESEGDPDEDDEDDTDDESPDEGGEA